MIQMKLERGEELYIIWKNDFLMSF
jgi:hypothetical protein